MGSTERQRPQRPQLGCASMAGLQRSEDRPVLGSGHASGTYDRTKYECSMTYLSLLSDATPLSSAVLAYGGTWAASGSGPRSVTRIECRCIPAATGAGCIITPCAPLCERCSRLRCSPGLPLRPSPRSWRPTSQSCVLSRVPLRVVRFVNESGVIDRAESAAPSRAGPRWNGGSNYVRPATGQRRITARWLATIPQSGGGYHLMAQQQLEAMGRR